MARKAAIILSGAWRCTSKRTQHHLTGDASYSSAAGRHRFRCAAAAVRVIQRLHHADHFDGRRRTACAITAGSNFSFVGWAKGALAPAHIRMRERGWMVGNDSLAHTSVNGPRLSIRWRCPLARSPLLYGVGEGRHLMGLQRIGRPILSSRAQEATWWATADLIHRPGEGTSLREGLVA